MTPGLLRLVAVVIATVVTFVVMPTAQAAQSRVSTLHQGISHVAGAPITNSWIGCFEHLDATTMTRVVKWQCSTYTMAKETRKPVGYVRKTSYISPHVRYWSKYPFFTRPIVYGLPGCPFAIAQWASLIVPAAHLYGVPVPIMTGVMQIESGGNPYARNPSSGAAGLYQFLPSTAASFGINPYNPFQAVYAAAKYIRSSGLSAFSGGGYASAWGCD